MGWNPIDTAPREHEKTVLLSDGIGLPAYEGYWNAFEDFELSDDTDFRMAGMELAERREAGGFWYTKEGYCGDAEHSYIGSSKKFPQFWTPMPEPPAEPVTLATLPGELMALGLEHVPSRGTFEAKNGDGKTISIYATALQVLVIKVDGYGVKTTTKPADALELVKLLMKVDA